MVSESLQLQEGYSYSQVKRTINRTKVGGALKVGGAGMRYDNVIIC